MKLSNIEIENRINIKLDKSIKDDTSSGIMTFGEMNDYPQIIEKLIYGSQTASSTAKIFAKFIGGEGFENKEIGKVVVGKDNKGKNITLDKIRKDICKSISFFNGFYIHTNINLGGEVVDSKLVPFKNCRFSREDDLGYCGRIAVSNEWTKKGKKIINWYNVFNLEKNVLFSNIENAGGIEKFNGQIYFGFIEDNFLYPISPFDSVYLDMDTENQVQLYKNSEIRNGFSDKVIFNINMSDDEEEQIRTKNTINSFLGPDGPKALVFQSEFDENGNLLERTFKIDKVENNINEKLFESSWEKGLSNNIRKAANGLPAVLIDYDQGGLSQASGEMIIQATKYYNDITKDIRSSVAEMIKEIYSNHTSPILKNNTNWNILPNKIIDENTTNV